MVGAQPDLLAFRPVAEAFDWNESLGARIVRTRIIDSQYWKVQEAPILRTKVVLNEGLARVFIDSSAKLNHIQGFGAAVTDAAAEMWHQLPESLQQDVIDACFSDRGLNYNIVRTNMGRCDFSTDEYSYVKEGDRELKTFDISHDDQHKIPMIKAAQKAIESARNNDSKGQRMKLFFSPWSPPGWMKDNGSALNGGVLLAEFYEPWARWFILFIKEMRKRGIEPWGFTVQNESLGALPWESCVWSPEAQRLFIADYLGPLLRREGMQHLKLMIFDHNRTLMPMFVGPILSDPKAAKYVWGIAVHWYDTWFSPLPLFDNLLSVKESFPDKEIFFSEGCCERYEPRMMSDIVYGERYGLNMLNDLKKGVSGWTDWNCLLNHLGGPNHQNNWCLAPLMANVDKKQIFYTTPFWYIGHFSRYIQENARRLPTAVSHSDVLTVAFANPDDTIVVIVMNMTGKDINYIFQVDDYSTTAIAQSHSIATWLVNLKRLSAVLDNGI